MTNDLFAGHMSLWFLCLLQITSLLLGSWVTGRILRRKFPELATSIGIVALVVSATVVLVTFTGVPRPFEISAAAGELPLATESAKQGLDNLQPIPNSHTASSTLLEKLATLISYSPSSENLMADNKQAWQWLTPAYMINGLLVLTILGSLLGIFQFIHSSIVIFRLSRSSSLIEDPAVEMEVTRLLAKIPDFEKPKNITVRRFKGLGSPFVSWLSGNTIYVPEKFATWTMNEQSASLAHEIGHLQRRDHFFHVISQMAFYVTWLHPMSWVLRRQIMLSQELAADQIAAQLTKNTTVYCRGLSRLALRFDAECRHSSTVGVSVSSNLIRRITMLRKSKFHRITSSRFINRLVTCTTLLVFTWIGCWSVAAQETPQEKQSDSPVVTASNTSPIKMFSQPKARPWDAIGNQPGYFSIQAKRILNHPELKSIQPLLTASLESILHSTSAKEASCKQFGLNINDIEWVQSGCLISYYYDSEAPDGRRSRLSMGASDVEVKTTNPVDWRGLVKAIDFDKLSGLLAVPPKVKLDAVQEGWLKAAKHGRSNVFQLSTMMRMDGFKWEKPLETKKLLWKAVSGGAVTAVYDIVQSGEVPNDYKEEGALNHANMQMTLATQTAAWGFDLTPDYKNCQIRFAAVPKAGISMDEFLKKFDAVKNAMLNTDADDDFSKHFIAQLKKAKVSVVKGRMNQGKMTPSYLLVVGECSADIGKYRLVKIVSAPRLSKN